MLKLLYAKKTFIYLALAAGLHAFCIYGLLNWPPSFLARLHGMKSSEIGGTLGLIYGLGGAAGTFAGGLLTDYLGKSDKRWYLKVPAFAGIVCMFFAAGALFLQKTVLSLVCISCCAFLQSLYLGPAIAWHTTWCLHTCGRWRLPFCFW